MPSSTPLPPRSKLNVESCATNMTQALYTLVLDPLQTSYVDLLLLHHAGRMPTDKNPHPPCFDASLAGTKGSYYQCRMDTIVAFEALRAQGLIRAWGVSNWNVRDLTQAFDQYGYYPSVNQIEMHPYFNAREIVSFCNKKGIKVRRGGWVWATPIRVAQASYTHAEPLELLNDPPPHHSPTPPQPLPSPFQVTGYAPVGDGDRSHLRDDPLFPPIAAAHNVTVRAGVGGGGLSHGVKRAEPYPRRAPRAPSSLPTPHTSQLASQIGQVILRYSLSTGADIVIPRSQSAVHQAENLAIFDGQGQPSFELSEWEVAAIASVHNYTKIYNTDCQPWC